ncbi:MAG: RND transporter [Bacteroidales bacterium 45-6]|mgnify:CR=1 FL=1|nr:MAG: RND transporter [Bacteroidales bacterium 45-6]
MKINKIHGAILLGVVLSAGMTSCKTSNRYKSPEVDAANLYRDTVTTDTTSIASLSWKEYFKDPKLQQLIEEGLANNFDLKIALQRVEQAKSYYSSAKKAALPSIGLGGTITHNTTSSKSEGGSVSVLSKNSNQYAFGLGAIWEVDLWGKLSRQSKAKYAQYLNSQESRNLIQSNMIAGIATYYYTLLSLDEQLRITHETIGLLKETVNTMDALKESGQLNAASVEQTKATLYSAEVSIPDLEMAIHQAENSLSLLLGRKAGGVERSSFAEQEVPKELKVGLPIQMLANRPDVKSAELTFRSAFESTNAAKANFYPTVSLTQGSLIGFGASNIADLFRPENLLARVLGSVVQPIFAQGQLAAGLKAAKAEQEAALLSFQKTVLEAGNEVSNVLYNYSSSLKKNDLREKQVTSLKNSVEYTQLLLKAGESNYLEVITAESNLLNAQLSQVSDKLEQLQATVDLYKALGGGTK